MSKSVVHRLVCFLVLALATVSAGAQKAERAHLTTTAASVCSGDVTNTFAGCRWRVFKRFIQLWLHGLLMKKTSMVGIAALPSFRISYGN